MKSWVIVSIGVALAAAISAKPLSRLRKPEKNDKLKIGLALAVVLAAVVVAYAPRKRKSRMVGGAQCTVRTAPQIGAGYTPYVVPKDLTVGGASVVVGGASDGGGNASVESTGYFEPVPVEEVVPAIQPTYDVPAVVSDGPAIPADIPGAMDVVDGGTLRLMGEF